MVVDCSMRVGDRDISLVLRTMTGKLENGEKPLQNRNAESQLKSPLQDILNRESTVFLTPPSSTEIPRTVARAAASTNRSDSDLEALLNFDDIYDDMKVDFITKFTERSLECTVGNRIFRRLTDIELLRASHVNKTWRDVVLHRNILSGRRLRRFITQRRKLYIQKGKENHPDIRCFTEGSTIRVNIPKILLTLEDRTNRDQKNTSYASRLHSLSEVSDVSSSSRCRASSCSESYHNALVLNGTVSEGKDYLVGCKASKKRLKRLSFS